MKMTKQKLYCTFSQHPHEVPEKKYKSKCSKKNNGEGCEYLFQNDSPSTRIDYSEAQNQIIGKKTIEKRKQKKWNHGYNGHFCSLLIEEDDSPMIPISKLQREFKKLGRGLKF